MAYLQAYVIKWIVPTYAKVMTKAAAFTDGLTYLALTLALVLAVIIFVLVTGKARTA